MAIKKYPVLIIDDHPLIVEAYKTALKYYTAQQSAINFTIQIAENCDSALQLINGYKRKGKEPGLVFLDMKLPPSKDHKALSREDLGLKINKLFPKTKIIVATTLNDNYRVDSILRSINPDGFLIKNDITPKELIQTIHTVLTDPPYYSHTVLKLLRTQIENNFFIDAIDRRILYELSTGTRMKELPNILPLSIAGIEKRKRQLKKIFDVSSLEDKQLIIVAKEKGFI